MMASVDLPRERHDRRDRSGQRLAGARHGLLHAVEQTTRLLRLQRRLRLGFVAFGRCVALAED
jgi:hypothetical protein